MRQEGANSGLNICKLASSKTVAVVIMIASQAAGAGILDESRIIRLSISVIARYQVLGVSFVGLRRPVENNSDGPGLPSAGEFHRLPVRCGRVVDRTTNLCRYAIDRASCARTKACGEEGSGDGLTTSVKPASLKQESAMFEFGHGLNNGAEVDPP